MGSEYYVYFVVASEQVSSTELAELAEDIGGADLPRTQGGVQVTARLSAETFVWDNEARKYVETYERALKTMSPVAKRDGSSGG